MNANAGGEKPGQNPSSTQVQVQVQGQTSTEALSSLTIPIPLIAQNLFAGDPKFLNSLIETIKESVKGIQVEVHPGCITVTVGPRRSSRASGEAIAMNRTPNRLQSQRPESIRRVDVLGEMIQDHMRQWHSLQRQVTGLDKRDALFTEEFAVPRNRMGLAIGPRGENINAARSVEGVELVNNSDRFLNKGDFYLFQVGHGRSWLGRESHATESFSLIGQGSNC